MYGCSENPAAPKALSQFRLKTIPAGEHREVLHGEFGVPSRLVTKLYATHDKCRRQLARVELKIYYSLIPRTKRRMREIFGQRQSVTDELMSWQNFVRHMDKLEKLLKVKSPRAEKLRQHIEKWKEDTKNLK